MLKPVPSIFLFVAMSVVAVVPSAAQAQNANGEPCVELFRQCYSQQEASKIRCLHDLSSDKRCAGDGLSTLSFQRWLISPSHGQDSQGQDSPLQATKSGELLGPHRVNQECLVWFDNIVSSHLIGGDINDKVINSLKNRLLECVPNDTQIRP